MFALSAPKCLFIIQLIFGSCGQQPHHPQVGLSHHHAAVHRHHFAGVPLPRHNPRATHITPTIHRSDRFRGHPYPFVWKGQYALPPKWVQIWSAIG